MKPPAPFRSLSRFYKSTLSRKQSISTIYREVRTRFHLPADTELCVIMTVFTFVSDIPDEPHGNIRFPKADSQPIIEVKFCSSRHSETADKNRNYCCSTPDGCEDSDIVLLISRCSNRNWRCGATCNNPVR